MKDSGIEWIGKIPEQWNVIPLKFLVKCNTETLNEKENDDKTISYIDISSVNNCGEITNIQEFEFKDAPSRARRLLHKQDIIVSTVRTYLKAIAQIDDEHSKCICSTGFAVLTPLKNVIANYLYYILFSNYFTCLVEAYSNGISYPAINTSDLVSLQVIIPPIIKQHIISIHLDRKCGDIDKLILLQEQMINELKAYKQSIITEAITKGLDKSVPMKDSGIEWVGKIPANWKTVRIKALFHEINDRNMDDENAILLSLFTAIGVKPRSEMEDKGNKSITVIDYKKVSFGDLIVNKLLAWMGAIAYSDYEGVTSPDYDVYRAYNVKAVYQSYYNFYFRFTLFKDDCYKYGHGIMMMRWRTYSDEFLGIHVVNPPINEQIAIADYLDKKCSEIDKLISIKQTKLAELKEYKKSLIYECVTGKREVS